MSGLILSDVLRMCLCIQYYPMPFLYCQAVPVPLFIGVICMLERL